MTKSDIRHNYAYRDNPENRYHDSYQSMVNRVFLVFLVFMAEILVWSFHGLFGVFLSIPIAMVGLLSLGVVLSVLNFFGDMFFEFVDWISGN